MPSSGLVMPMPRIGQVTVPGVPHHVTQRDEPHPLGRGLWLAWAISVVSPDPSARLRILREGAAQAVAAASRRSAIRIGAHRPRVDCMETGYRSRRDRQAPARGSSHRGGRCRHEAFTHHQPRNLLSRRLYAGCGDCGTLVVYTYQRRCRFRAHEKRSTGP